MENKTIYQNLFFSNGATILTMKKYIQEVNITFYHFKSLNRKANNLFQFLIVVLCNEISVDKTEKKRLAIWKYNDPCIKSKRKCSAGHNQF